MDQVKLEGMPDPAVLRLLVSDGQCLVTFGRVAGEWRARPLDEVYPIMYIDAIRLRIRDGGAVRMKACHIAIGA